MVKANRRDQSSEVTVLQRSSGSLVGRVNKGFVSKTNWNHYYSMVDLEVIIEHLELFE